MYINPLKKKTIIAGAVVFLSIAFFAAISGCSGPLGGTGEDGYRTLTTNVGGGNSRNVVPWEHRQ